MPLIIFKLIQAQVHQLASVQPFPFLALSQILMSYCLHISFFFVSLQYRQY